ncbi:hypothetical protein ACP70R_001044 [Stipagrostis hirtigluma subsp. patula]
MADGEGECSAPAPASRKGPQARSHSEAERKRRQRINAHLATLRTLVPSASRMDKAALLGEVVRHVRELRAKATEAAEGAGVVVPGESDEVGVEEDDDDRRPDRCRRYGAGADANAGHRRPRRVRAWVCCADRPGLMSDLGRAVRSASARPLRAEIATVGGRTRSVMDLDVACCDDDDAMTAAGNGRAVALSTVRAALRAVLLNRDEGERLAAAGAYKRPRFAALVAATVQQ